MIKRWILLLFAVPVVCSSFSQTQKFSGWSMYLHTIKITNKFSSHLDIQLRTDDNWKNAETFIFRPGINYHVNNKSTLTLGYAFIDGWKTIDGARGAVPEHRIWQQWNIAQKISDLTLNHRLRLEERFIADAANENGEIVKTKTLYSTRFRYFLRILFPLPHQARFEKGFFTALQNEIFVNISNKENVNQQFFDQNRLYGAMGWRFSSKFDLETGYLYQFVSGTNNSTTQNHILQIAGYLRL